MVLVRPVAFAILFSGGMAWALSVEAYALTAVSGTLSLPQLTVTVLATNAQIRAAEEILIVQNALVRARWGAFLPHVSAVGQFGTRTIDATPSRHSHPTAQQILLTQPLTLGDETANLSGAKAEARAAAAKAATTIQSTLLATAQAYVGVLQAQTVVSQTEQFVTNLEKQKRVAEVQFKSGEATQTNVLQATARLLGARAELAQATSALTTAQEKLAALGDASLRANVQVTPLIWPSLPQSIPTTEPSATQLVPHHPVYEAAYAVNESLHAKVWAAATHGLPEVSLNAAAGRTTETYTRTDAPINSRSLTVNVSVPLFQGGQVVSAWQGAKAAARAGGYQVDDARQNLTTALASAWGAWQASQLAASAAEQALVAQQSATQGIRAEYKGGERSFIDLLNAEQDLKQAHVQHATAKAGQLVAAYALLAAMGQLTPEHIQ